MPFDGLNPAQLKAVQTLSGPLLVLAGAGTGKTRVVTYRIANLIRHKTAPSRILAVTFTNRAAAEMQERIGGLLGRRGKDKPLVSTFHAYCVQILRRQIQLLGFPPKFVIYDRGDQESVARSVLRELRVPGESLRPSDVLHQIGQWKTHAVSPREASAKAQTDQEHLAAMAFRRYQQTLKNRGAVDFDDLLLYTVELFRKSPAALEEEAGRFSHLLVDEYQDTNDSQYRIVKALASRHRNLCVVGDDDQSIYGWRGAEVQHILGFQRDWPDATVVRLEENYRSTAEILDMANRLIAFNKKRHPKVLRATRSGGQVPRIEQPKDETAEAKAVVADISRLTRSHDWEHRDFAILFRTNEQPRAFETELRKADVPYVLIGGQSFFDRKEVRDVLAYLRVVASPDDEISLLRIINTPPRGIGSKTVERLLAEAVRRGVPVWEMLQQVEQGKLAVGDAARRGVAGLCSLVNHFRTQMKREDLVGSARQLLTEIDYEGELRRLYPQSNESEARWAAVEEVINALGAFQSQSQRPTLAGFLDEMTLGGDDFDNKREKQLKRNAVVLLTLHSAKGLEFPHVYMVGMEEGLLPHHRSEESETIDEERRLCYVGVTRAQERLTLSMALTRMKWGRPKETLPSRFLFELIGKADNPLILAAKAPGTTPSSGKTGRKSTGAEATRQSGGRRTKR